MNRAVFLDRDGTVAKDVPYCSRPEDLEILPTVTDAISMLKTRGFKVIMVTNQSGIARGYFTEETLRRIHEKMQSDLAQYDVRLDAIYYCPHHPDDNCQCRKPRAGLLMQAAAEHNIDLCASYIVGDTQMDITSGKVAQCKTVLVTTGPNAGKEVIDLPDYIAHSLFEACEWIDNDARNSIAHS